MYKDIGHKMYAWAEVLFPLCRSLTGKGVRETLSFIKSYNPDLVEYSVKSGTKVYDWEVPKEWEINEAFIEDLKGNRIIDFKNNNLHVLGYSTGIDKTISLAELQDHLYSLENLPDAIPYVTSYYQENWGFCVPHNLRKELNDAAYKIFIDSKLFNGVLNYGEILVPGKSNKEIIFSTYICHPSMANNELSGIVLAMAILDYVKASKNNYYSYRFLFLPETIGSITYISKNLSFLKKHTKCGFILTCVGNIDKFSFMPSRTGNTYADKVAKYVLDSYYPGYNKYTFLDRGSDERQFCSPKVNLPFVSIMKSKYKEYKEYHTSLDNLSFISPIALTESFDLYIKCIKVIETNQFYLSNQFCEPMLSKRNLYPKIGGQIKDFDTKLIKDIVALIDGSLDLIDLANVLNKNYFDVCSKVEILLKNNLIVAVKERESFSNKF